MNAWQTENGPLWLLAPMEEVTDTVFRQVIRGASGTTPLVFYTEFTSTDGLTHQKGRLHSAHRLHYTEGERPLIAQIWGKNPDHYYQVAKDIVALGFDGIDINMGCPVKKIVKQGSCSALIKNPALASEIIRAVQAGVAGQIPVSVKTRIGFETVATEEWCGHLLGHDLAALIVHGRTVKELSKVACHWDEIAKVVKLRNSVAPSTLIIGNGDVQSRLHGEALISQTRVDGVMVGRGIFKNPWLFHEESRLEGDRVFLKGVEVSSLARIDLFLHHLRLWRETYTADEKNYHSLRKCAKMYLQGFAGASNLRQNFMETGTVEEGLDVLERARTRLEKILSKSTKYAS